MLVNVKGDSEDDKEEETEEIEDEDDSGAEKSRCSLPQL